MPRLSSRRRRSRSTVRPSAVAAIVWAGASGCSSGSDGGAAPPSELSVGAHEQVLAEGAIVEIALELDRPAAADRPVVLAVGGTAAQGEDYIASLEPSTIPVGASRTVLRLEVVDDALNEDTETIELAFSSPNLDSNPAPISIAVADDDPEPTIRFADVPTELVEGAEPVDIVAALSAPSGREVRCTLAADGTAEQGEDYAIAVGEIVFPPGIDRVTRSFRAFNDGLPEPVEDVELSLRDPVFAALGTPARAAISILPAPVVIEFSGTAPTVPEASGSIALDWTLSEPQSVAHTIPIVAEAAAVSGATPGEDALVPISLEIAVGATSGSLEVEIVDDELFESAEGFHVTLAPEDGILVGETSSMLVTIVDDDVEPQIVFATRTDDGMELRLTDRRATLVETVAEATWPSTISSVRWSPAGDRIAFLSDAKAAGQFEPYLVSLSDFEELSVAGPVAPGGDAVELAWNADGSWLAYRADERVNGRDELFVVRADETASVPASALEIPGGDVGAFAWAPTGTRIAYQADATVDGRVDLFVTRADALAEGAIVSNPAAVAGLQGTPAFAWSPDGTQLAYLADGGGQTRVFLVSEDGAGGFASPVAVSTSEHSSANAVEISWSPQGGLLSYLADSSLDERFELFAVAVNPLARPYRLSGDLASGGDVFEGMWSWNAGGDRVAYMADRNSNAVNELFSSSADALSDVRLNAPPGIDGDVRGFRWAPTGSHVAYASDEAIDDTVELFVVTGAGEERVRVSALIGAGEALDPASVTWAPSAEWLVYATTVSATATYTLASASGGETVELVVGSTPSATVAPVQWTPDSNIVVYAAAPGGGPARLFAHVVDSGSVFELSGDGLDSEGVLEFELR